MRQHWETYIAKYPWPSDFARQHTRQNLEDNPMRIDPGECGKRIKALRENKNLTRAQLAEQLNISFVHMRMA